MQAAEASSVFLYFVGTFFPSSFFSGVFFSICFFGWETLEYLGEL